MASIRDFLQRTWFSLPLKTRDVVTRAAKTAAQTFIATFPLATLATGDANVIWPALVAAGSAAVSAAWNVIKTPSSGEVKLVPVYVHPHPDDILPEEGSADVVWVAVVVLVVLVFLKVFAII
jgi:hypothetical protein